MAEHDPISYDPRPLSEAKRTWWQTLWPKNPSPKQPRQAVLFYALSSVMRPTAPQETVLFGYLSNEKFHDREPEALLKAIETLDPKFFDTFPRKPGKLITPEFKRAVIGEAAQAFCRCGIPSYGKPGLRKGSKKGIQPGPLATI